ncbi:hypothetical protein BBJ28_00012760, partial [Nothophytophthora sp. Chile5]
MAGYNHDCSLLLRLEREAKRACLIACAPVPQGVSLPKVSSGSFTSGNGIQEVDSGEVTPSNAPYCLEVLKCILVREGYLQRLGRSSAAGRVSGAHLGETVDVLDFLRLATLETVEAIVLWRKHKRERGAEEKPNGATKPLPILEPEPFRWNGINYLLKLASDLEFLGKHPGLIQWLGFTLERNPFILPLNLDYHAKMLLEEQQLLQPEAVAEAPDSNRFVQVGGKRSQPSTRDGLRSSNGHGNTGNAAAASATLAQALAERKRAKTPYETRVVNDEELVPTTPSKSGALRPKSRAPPRAGSTGYSSVLPSQIGDVDMARLHQAEVVVVREEAVFGRYSRDLQGRVVPEAEAHRRIGMMELSDGVYNSPSSPVSYFAGKNPENGPLRVLDPAQSELPGDFHAKKRSGMLGPISKPEWRSFERPPPPRRRARGAHLEEALAAERRANARLGVMVDQLREETERKAMDVAYFESCIDLQLYGNELRALSAQALRELTVLRRELQEKRHLYESKNTNIQQKEELLNTFKAQHKAVTDANHVARIELNKQQATKIPSLNQQQQQREDQEHAADRAVAAVEQHEHAQATPLVQHFCATLIQKIARGMLARKFYAMLKIEYVVASTFIQAVARGFLVRRRVARLYCHNAAAVQMQRVVRGWLARLLVKRKRRQRLMESCSKHIQKVVRGHFGRLRMKRLRKLVFWRRQLALSARSVNAVALQELSIACQTMIALPKLMRAASTQEEAEQPLPALVLGLVRLLMIFTSDADDEWEIPSVRWREAARFLRCSVGLSRRMQKIADAASGAAGMTSVSTRSFGASGVATPRRRLRASPLGSALLKACTGDLQFCIHTFECLPHGWQAASAIFQWITAFSAITRLQDLLDLNALYREPFLVVRDALSKREAQQEATERREAQQEEQAEARRFVPAELVQAPGYPHHRPRPLLVVLANDLPRKARAAIVEKLLVALPGLFLVLNRPPKHEKRLRRGDGTTNAFDFSAIGAAMALGHGVVVEGDVGLRDVTQRSFLSSFATVKSALHPSPLCVLLRGSTSNRSDLPEVKEGAKMTEEQHWKEARDRMADADVKFALERTALLRLELSDEIITRQMLEQSKCGVGDQTPAPSAALIVVMEAVIVLLTPSKSYEGPSYEATTAASTSAVSWRLARRLLAQPAFLLSKLQQVDPTTVPSGNLTALERYVRLPNWPSAAVARSQQKASGLLLSLAAWVEAASCAARLIAADGSGSLAPEITRASPVAGLFGRVIVFRNSTAVGATQDGSGEDTAVMELLDAVLADVRVYRTAHLLGTGNCRAGRSHQEKKEQCIVSVFHECRRIFVNAYSPQTGRRWLTVLSEDDVDALLMPTTVSLDRKGGSESARAVRQPPFSHADMYSRLVQLCGLQRRPLSATAESSELATQQELVVHPRAVRLYRHALQLGGFLSTVTIAELARGHVQVDVFVHGKISGHANAQAVALSMTVELESVLGRLSAAQARRVFVAASHVPLLVLDRLHLFRPTQTQHATANSRPMATASASSLRLSVKTAENAPGRVLLRRAMRIPSTNDAAASGERWLFTLLERHEHGDFQAAFYAPRTSAVHTIRLSSSAALELVRLSRQARPSQLRTALLRSFRFAEAESVEEDGEEGDDADAETETDALSCCRTRRRVLARFPCALPVAEDPHQVVTKKQVVRVYVQAELSDEEEPEPAESVREHGLAESGGGEVLRYRLWLPGSCEEQTLVLQESEVEASLPATSSWRYALKEERNRLSREIARSFFEWEVEGEEQERGRVVARLP